jgi:hypothetical protein
MPLQIADCDLLRASLRRLFKSPNFWERLAWGARTGSGWERQFQFDWGFQIEQELLGRGKRFAGYNVGCETAGRVDISILDSETGALRARIELHVVSPRKLWVGTLQPSCSSLDREFSDVKSGALT